MRILYFAYGSNMSTECFRSRVASAKIIGCAYLEGKKLAFNKRSVDSSGKANLVDSPGDITWGVLYEIDHQSLDVLDEIETGYERVSVQVHKVENAAVTVVTYISDRLTNDPVPFEWYKELVLSGAREHDLPSEYLAYLEQFPCRPDPTRAEE